MTRYESSTVSIGFKIAIKELVKQLNEDNFYVVKKLFEEGFIPDSNGTVNQYFKSIIDDEDIPDDCKEYKSHLKKHFKKIVPNDKDDEKVSINDMYLLVPVHKIMETTRWGKNRKGTNGTFCEIDFDIENLKEQIKNEYEHMFSKYNVVFMLNQEAD